MKRVILESPYAGQITRNLHYAKLALKDSLLRGEAPLVSHLLYTQVLQDEVPAERERGISAGLAWLRQAEEVVFYVDYGMSPGMTRTFLMVDELEIPYDMRYILTLK